MSDKQNNRLGYAPVGTPNVGTFAVNDVNVRHALSFIAPSTSRTLTSAAHYLSAVTGSLTAAQLPAELHADAAGSPSNTPLETVDCDQTPSALAVHTWTFSTALTAGGRYWIVWKNLHGTPTSNYATFRWGSANSGPASGAIDATIHWARRTSTDASTWATTSQATVAGLRVGYDDASYDGYPFHNIGASVVGDGIYDTRELGDLFTTPNDAKPRVRGLRMHLTTKTGTPTGTLRFRLYEGTSLLGTTVALYTTAPTTAMYEAFFASTLVLAAGTAHRAVIGESTQTDASTNRYNAREYFIFDDAPSRALMPFQGTLQKTYFNGSTWANTNTSIIPMELILDSDDPFDVSGGGGGTRPFRVTRSA